MTTTAPRLNPGDIVLIQLPLSGSAGRKQRPALAVLVTGDADVVVCPITSQPARTRNDVALLGWREARPRLPSRVRLDKPATVLMADISRVLGRLTATDHETVRAELARLWASF